VRESRRPPGPGIDTGRSMTTLSFDSLPGICDATLVRGRSAPTDGPPDLLLEIPHGATRAAHFEALKAQLVGPLPAGLADFFFVNTDVGAPEVAERMAAHVTKADPRRRVLVLRCLLPRTFVDCNRVIESDARPTASAAGETTPGIAPYVQDPRDVKLLYARYRAYREMVEAAYETVCSGGGSAAMVHTYAPRSIDVPVDDRIVERLRAEYEPHRIEAWPLRAEVDLITKTPDGTRLASDAWIDCTTTALRAAGIQGGADATYALSASTLGCVFGRRWRNRTLCVEIRRDLLVPTFTPFQEMDVAPDRAERVGRALAEAWLAWQRTGARSARAPGC